MEKVPGRLYYCYSSHPPCRGQEGIFLRSSHENLGFLGRKDLRLWGPLMIEAPGVSHCHTSPHSASSNLPQLLEKLSGPTLITLVCSVVSLWIHLSLQIPEHGLSWNFNYLMNLRKVTDFQFAQVFLVVRMGRMTFKLFTCQSENQQSAN